MSPKLPLLITAIGLTMFFSASVLSSAHELMISEIMYDPVGSDEKKEWIEIINDSDKKLELEIVGKNKDQYILPLRTCTKKDEEKCATSHPIYVSKKDIEVDKNELVIITSDKDEFEKNYPDYKGQIWESKFSLPNKDESFVGLYIDDKTAPEWQDKVSYSTDWGASENNKTLEKVDLDDPDEKNNWPESVLPGGTPGKKYQKIKIEYSTKIKINELWPDPAEGEKEKIEIFNDDDKTVDLGGWSIQDQSGKQYFFKNQKIKENDFLVLGAEETKISLNNDKDEVALLNPAGEVVDKTSYNKVKEKGWSWARKNDKDFEWTPFPTFGQKNKFLEKKNYPGLIKFNEILPNPKGADKDNEWVELRNENNFEVDLSGWIITNKSKKKVVIPEKIIQPKDFIVINLKSTSFQIGNSQETLSLLNPNEELVDQLSFAFSAKENVSLAKKEASWKWTRFLTPGKENKLNNLPQIKLTKPANVYKQMPAEFDASQSKDKDKDKLKFSWDFGDGHRSYLEKVSHAFEKNGKYTVSLKIDDGSEAVLKSFKLKVESYPQYELEIISFLPNPTGKDGGNEYVEIRNHENKKMSLEKFKLATGRDKKHLVNHILPAIEIEPNSTIKISNQDSKFYLLNKFGTVALVYPNGKIADMVKYQKSKIEEDESYVKINGNWQWQTLVVDPDNKGSILVEENEENIESDVNASIEEVSSSEENAIPVPGVFHDADQQQCLNLDGLVANNWRIDCQHWLKFL